MRHFWAIALCALTARAAVDRSTLSHKLMVGYQAWCVIPQFISRFFFVVVILSTTLAFSLPGTRHPTMGPGSVGSTGLTTAVTFLGQTPSTSTPFPRSTNIRRPFFRTLISRGPMGLPRLSTRLKMPRRRRCTLAGCKITASTARSCSDLSRTSWASRRWPLATESLRSACTQPRPRAVRLLSSTTFRASATLICSTLLRPTGRT